MTIVELETEVAAIIREGEQALSRKQREVEDRYRIPGSLYWQVVKRMAQKKAQSVKSFTNEYPDQQYVFVPAVNGIMNYLLPILNFSEAMIIVSSQNRPNN